MNWSTDALWNVGRCPRIGEGQITMGYQMKGRGYFQFPLCGGRGDRSFLEQLAIEANLILFYCETTYFFVCFNCIAYTDYHKLGTLTLKTGCIWPLLIIFVQSLAELIIHKVITELKFCMFYVKKLKVAKVTWFSKSPQLTVVQIYNILFFENVFRCALKIPGMIILCE